MKLFFYIIPIVLPILYVAQEQPHTRSSTKGREPYRRNEEIIYQDKRYKVHNNYFTLGPGVLSSSLRGASQKNLGIDFQFHIKRQHFQAGIMMSGATLGSNNNLQAHLCYGYRREGKTSNVAAFVGPSYFTGVTGTTDSAGNSLPLIYSGVGIYACAQAVYKIIYDIGLGGELFAEYSARQRIVGFKIIVFFSSAYVGPKHNYNPNVRSENPR